MTPLEPRSKVHWILLAILVFCWGISFALTKQAVTLQSPEWTVAIRLVIGALMIWLAMRAQGEKLPKQWTVWKWFIWLGAVGSLFPFLLISWGTQYVSSGLAGILMAVIPLFIALAGHYLLKDEPLTRTRFSGLLVGFSGLIILLSPAITDGFPEGYRPLLAQFAILLAAFSYGIQALTARLSPPMSALQKAAGTHVTAAISAVCIALLFDAKGIGTITQQGFILSFLLGILSTGLAGIVLFYLLEKTGAGFVSLSNYLLSPFAFLLGILFMAEPWSWQSFIGLSIILLGIGLSERGKAK